MTASLRVEGLRTGPTVTHIDQVPAELGRGGIDPAGLDACPTDLRAVSDPGALAELQTFLDLVPRREIISGLSWYVQLDVRVAGDEPFDGRIDAVDCTQQFAGGFIESRVDGPHFGEIEPQATATAEVVLPPPEVDTPMEFETVFADEDGDRIQATRADEGDPRTSLTETVRVVDREDLRRLYQACGSDEGP